MIASIPFTRAAVTGKFWNPPDGISFAVYQDEDYEVARLSFWNLDPAITPLYLTFTHDSAYLSPTSCKFNSPSNVMINVIPGVITPAPPGGWSGTDPISGNGKGGRGGDATGNGNGGNGGNGSGRGSGGSGGAGGNSSPSGNNGSDGTP